MELLLQHHDYFFYAVAALCLIVDLALLGLSGPLLFTAIGSFITAVIISVGLINGWAIEVFCAAIFSVLSAVVLWNPLKKFQNAGGGSDTSSDMIGKVLPVVFEINQMQGRIAYSGIEWQARLDPSCHHPIIVGSHARISAVDGSMLIVKPA